MNETELIELQVGKAICYSGFREGQNPGNGIYPSHEEILEDLEILEKDWTYIRLYDAGIHAKRVLEVIEKHELNLKVMLGICLSAEMSNPNCPWGAEHSVLVLETNKRRNEAEIEELSRLANRYSEIVFAVSAGNEATVEWTDHLVSVEALIAYVRGLKNQVQQPVTFCENYVPWQDKLAPLVEEVDFISLHTYPLWEYQDIQDAIAYTKDNYYSVKNRYPHKPVVITEAGWATKSNGRGMHAHNASEEHQVIYCNQLIEWSLSNNIITFIFEAFDEDWKGSGDPLEPEKHWGLYTIDRQPKKIIKDNSDGYRCCG